MEPVPPRNPFAWINTGNNHKHPAVILHWHHTPIPGMYNMPIWEATCLYWDNNGQPATITLPADRVSSGSGPAR